LAYDSDNRKRAIFANVFARVIGQGTKFDVEDRSSDLGRHNRLAEVFSMLFSREAVLTKYIY
jgi:neurofibromin 1